MVSLRGRLLLSVGNLTQDHKNYSLWKRNRIPLEDLVTINMNINHQDGVVAKRLYGAEPRVWNNLPIDVVTASSVATFKQRLKTFLSAQSFDV